MNEIEFPLEIATIHTITISWNLYHRSIMCQQRHRCGGLLRSRKWDAPIPRVSKPNSAAMPLGFLLSSSLETINGTHFDAVADFIAPGTAGRCFCDTINDLTVPSQLLLTPPTYPDILSAVSRPLPPDFPISLLLPYDFLSYFALSFFSSLPPERGGWKKLDSLSGPWLLFFSNLLDISFLASSIYTNILFCTRNKRLFFILSFAVTTLPPNFFFWYNIASRCTASVQTASICLAKQSPLKRFDLVTSSIFFSQVSSIQFHRQVAWIFSELERDCVDISCIWLIFRAILALCFCFTQFLASKRSLIHHGRGRRRSKYCLFLVLSNSCHVINHINSNSTSHKTNSSRSRAARWILIY